MTPDLLSVDYYLDSHGHDCYRICLPEGGICSTVSSAHLIEERKTQLLRAYATTSTPCAAAPAVPAPESSTPNVAPTATTAGSAACPVTP